MNSAIEASMQLDGSTQIVNASSITVSYNARDSIKRQIDILRAGTPHLAQIIVVDNASTDGTAEMLCNEYPSVILLRMNENIGVGGAYCAGIRHAVVEQTCQWVWILDQDSSPSPNTLFELFRALQADTEPETIGVLAPLPKNPQTGASYGGVLWRNHKLVEAEARDANIAFVDGVISSGSLIRVSAILKAGLPREDFFIDYVDFEHCLRIRRQGFRIGIVPSCNMSHSIGQPAVVTEFGHSRVRAVHPPWREYYKTRNFCFAVLEQSAHPSAKLFILRKFIRHACGVLLYDFKKIQRLGFMIMGLVDGWRGRLGIRVPPQRN